MKLPMTVEKDFVSSLKHLILQDPWLPSKKWESIATEGGTCPLELSNSRSSKFPLDQAILSEAFLVKLSLDALYGVKSALDDVKELSTTFSLVPSDRTSHRIPNLWHRSSSSSAFGKILTSLGDSGLVCFLLHQFVDFFLGRNSSVYAEDNGYCPPYSLVNQAFAVTIGKLLDGYKCSLSTLSASVQLRRSSMSKEAPLKVDSDVCSLTSVVHSEVTMLDLYLHTKELRSQLEALGNICFYNTDISFSISSMEQLAAKMFSVFQNFPKGADLLTHLYTQLHDSDPVHHSLLKFLFTQSYEPYCGFIRSWIYQACIRDPFKEFIVEHDRSPADLHGSAGYYDKLSPSLIKERNLVGVPCFLSDVSVPLFRAGQQLQVLQKLLDLHNCIISSGYNSFRRDNHTPFADLKDILPHWTGYFGSMYWRSSLIFSKQTIDTVVMEREAMYRTMHEKLSEKFTSKFWQALPVSASLASLDSKVRDLTPNADSYDESLLSSPSTSDKGLNNFAREDPEIDAYGATDKFYHGMESPKYSDNSSFNDSDEYDEVDEPADILNYPVVPEPRHFSSLFSPQSSTEDLLPKTIVSGVIEDAKILPDVVHPYENALNDFPSNSFGGLKTSDLVETSEKFWPLGGLVRNPFQKNRGETGQIHLNTFDNILKDDPKGEILERNITCFNESDLFLSQIQEPPCIKYLSANPMLEKHAWFHRNYCCNDKRYEDQFKPSISCYDFSSVENPCMVYEERPANIRSIPTKYDHSVVKQACVSFEHPTKVEHYSLNDDQRSLESPLNRKPLSNDGSDASTWENLLSYSFTDAMSTSEYLEPDAMDNSDTPVEVIVDRCLWHEILLQYKYVSHFTIKLLEEGFELREHLLALRRYHFMELADWADSFLNSLWQNKWGLTEANQRISEIQAFLDSALQKSSCEKDVYKDRLFVYMREKDTIQIPASPFGIHAFDHIALGYRVQWPISIVLTPESLKIYADVFNFLIQVKLAVLSTAETWYSLKDLTHLSGRVESSGLDLRERKYFHILMKMRQQVTHFASVLQQYVQSQLTHVAWCRFMHSLKYKVKDMTDLEKVHMNYLVDSLDICFLSAESQPMSKIIESLLQCTLDFRSCVMSGQIVGFKTDNPLNVLNTIDFTRVLSVKATFDKNVKDIYLLYLRSPKHGKFDLSHLWVNLNYNDYYLNTIRDGSSICKGS